MNSAQSYMVLIEPYENYLLVGSPVKAAAFASFCYTVYKEKMGESNFNIEDAALMWQVDVETAVRWMEEFIKRWDSVWEEDRIKRNATMLFKGDMGKAKAYAEYEANIMTGKEVNLKDYIQSWHISEKEVNKWIKEFDKKLNIQKPWIVNSLPTEKAS